MTVLDRVAHGNEMSVSSAYFQRFIADDQKRIRALVWISFFSAFSDNFLYGVSLLQ